MRFIGDIHGKVEQWLHIAHTSPESVQVGDFGVGFLRQDRMNTASGFMGNFPQHRFIRGNHDNPFLCSDVNGFIEDGTLDRERSIMYVGGAWSIDWAWRTEGVSWWREEELSVPEFAKIHAEFVYSKPRIMVTHDAPTEAVLSLFTFPNSFGDFRSTRTNEAFQTMFYEHQPEVWIFGHWHEDKDLTVNGTRFICLDELSYVDLDV